MSVCTSLWVRECPENRRSISRPDNPKSVTGGGHVFKVKYYAPLHLETHRVGDLDKEYINLNELTVCWGRGYPYFVGSDL